MSHVELGSPCQWLATQGVSYMHSVLARVVGHVPSGTKITRNSRRSLGRNRCGDYLYVYRDIFVS